MLWFVVLPKQCDEGEVVLTGRDNAIEIWERWIGVEKTGRVRSLLPEGK